MFIKRFFVIVSSFVLLNACNSLPINKQMSVGQNARVQSLVLHFTALDYQRSMLALKDSGGVSSHYLIPELDDSTYPNSNLEIIQLVDENQRAWHAGRSYWDKRKNLNDTSIGIEIVNVPECQHHPVVKFTHGGEYGVHKDCTFPDFGQQQIALLIGLAKDILKRHPDITPTRVIGHSDISPSRKNDPGPRFPWYQLYENGIGAWYDSETQGKYLQLFESFAPSINLVQKALYYYGYNIKETGGIDRQTQDVLFAFQMHFLPWQVTGEINPETAAAVFALLEKYKEPQLKVLMSSYYREEAESSGFSQKLQTDTKHLVKSFYGVTGQGSLILIHPALWSLKDLSVSINGKKLKFAKPLSSKSSGIKVDISKVVKNGNNVLEVKSASDLSHASIEIIAPRLKGPQVWLERKLRNELTNELGTLEENFEFSLVQHDKVILHKAFGNKGLNGELHLTQLSSFFTTQLAVLRLIGEQRLQLTNSVYDYLPKYQGDGKANRTIKHVIEHTSGYPAVENYLQALEQANLDDKDINGAPVLPTQQGSVMNNPFSEASTETIDWTNAIFDVPFYYGVNQRRVYSEFNDLVLRLVIEQITNMPFEQYITTELLLPLGLTHSVFRRVQNNNASPISLLTTRMKDVLVLTQLLKNNGSYGNQHIFKPSEYSRWLQQHSFGLLAAKDSQLTKLNNIQKCSPYLTQSSHLSVADNSFVLVDDRLDISVIVSFQQEIKNDSNQCGLSDAQQRVLNKTLEVIYQSQR
jgi:N-acetylmuramoyl-L-alanine amidase